MTVTVYESLADLPGPVAAALAFRSTANLFLSLEWFQCLHDTVLAESGTPRIYVVSAADGAPLGAAVCHVPRGTRQLRGMTNYYTNDARSVVPFGGADSSVVHEQLIPFIAAERPRWRTLEFDYLRSDRSDAADLAGGARATGFACEVSRRYDNWYLPTEGLAFDAYYAARSSQMRNTIARKEKKLLKAHAVDIRQLREPGPELDAAIEQYVAIYNSSWKKPEPYPRFIPTLVRMAAQLGALRLGMLSVDGTPAAAQLWFVYGGRALIYKLAYDEHFAEFSPGSILSREMFRTAIDMDRVVEIDYGVGSEPYKREWMTAVRAFERVDAVNLRDAGGMGLVVLDRGKRIAKRVVKAVTSLRKRTVAN